MADDVDCWLHINKLVLDLMKYLNLWISRGDRFCTCILDLEFYHEMLGDGNKD